MIIIKTMKKHSIITKNDLTESKIGFAQLTKSSTNLFPTSLFARMFGWESMGIKLQNSLFNVFLFFPSLSARRSKKSKTVIFLYFLILFFIKSARFLAFSAHFGFVVSLLNGGDVKTTNLFL